MDEACVGVRAVHADDGPTPAARERGEARADGGQPSDEGREPRRALAGPADLRAAAGRRGGGGGDGAGHLVRDATEPVED